MKRLQRAAVLTELLDRLRQRGSWGGETHLQKATYLLQEALGVPLELSFVFYKHGPFSFELRDELSGLQADGLLVMERQPSPYGPKLVPTDESGKLRKRFPKTLTLYEHKIRRVVELVGSAPAAGVERLSTALFVFMEHPQLTQDEAASQIRVLKPHVSEQDSRDAVREISEFLESVGNV